MKAVLVIGILSWAQLSGQGLLQVQQPFAGWTYYGGHAVNTTNLSTLPIDIKEATSNYLVAHLGILVDSLTFSHGQVIDLDALFSDTLKVQSPNYLVPAYSLHYTLSNRSIGLKGYNLNLQIDQYGQLLHINWPKTAYTDARQFIDLARVNQYAFRVAKAKLYDIASVKIDCQYRSALDEIVWLYTFESIFTHQSKSTCESFILEISWTELKITAEYVRERRVTH